MLNGGPHTFDTWPKLLQESTKCHGQNFCKNLQNVIREKVMPDSRHWIHYERQKKLYARYFTWRADVGDPRAEGRGRLTVETEGARSTGKWRADVGDLRAEGRGRLTVETEGGRSIGKSTGGKTMAFFHSVIKETEGEAEAKADRRSRDRVGRLAGTAGEQRGKI
ncbi:hypothetical protein ACLOJK_001793 [Asimina triloba]